MGRVIELGATSILALIFWVLVFFLSTLIVELFVLRSCRKTLVKAKRPTRGATLALVAILCVLLPFVAAYFGFSFSVQRSAASALQRTTDTLVEAAVDRGVALAKKRFAIRDDDAPIDVDAVRKHARERRDAAGDGVLGALEHAWWWAVDAGLAEAGDAVRGLTWREIEALAKPKLEQGGKKLFDKFSDDLRASARTTLYLFLAIFVVVNAVAIVWVRRSAKRPVAPPSDPAATATAA